MKKRYSIFFNVLLFSLITFSVKSVAQCNCTPSGSFPVTVNGITIALSSSGSVTNYGGNWSSCGLTAGPMWVGQTGSFSQTFTFSSPVNNVSYAMTASDGGVEAFTFSAGSGVTTTSQCGTACPFSQVGNTFTSLFGDSGTIVIVSSTSTFTSMTVSGTGGSNGSLAGVCIQSFSSCVTPTLTVSPSAAICVGASKTLTVSGGTTYTWSPSGSLTTANNPSVVATPGSTTTYTVLSGTGSCTASAVTTVSVIPSPTVIITPTLTAICAGSSVALAANGATSYTWSPLPGLSSTNGSSVIVTPTTTTTYTVIGQSGICTQSATATVSVVAMPTLTVSPSSATLCAGSTATLTASGAATYTWSPATGLNTTSGNTVFASPLANTVYTLSGGLGPCTNTISAVVYINALPNLTVTPNVTAICSGSSTTLNVSGASTYTWSPSLSLSSANGSSVIASPGSSTTYTVMGTSGICTTTTTANVVVNPTPVVTVLPSSTTLCAGSTATLTAGGAATYTWSLSSTLSSTTSSVVTATPTASIIYTLTGGIGSCSSTTQVTITVNANPSLTLGPVAAICPGVTATLTAAGAATYSWNPSISLNSSTGATVSATPLNTTTYSVTGAVGTCTSMATMVLTITPSPTVNVVATTTICAGSSSLITASGANTYTWSPATGLNTTIGNTVSASPAVTTTYVIIGSLNSCTATASTTVTIVPNPVMVTGIQSDVCSGVAGNLSASGATTYQWMPAANVTSPTSATTTALPQSTTIYTVTGAAAGCTSTAVMTISVTPTPALNLTAVPATICEGSSITLSANGATTYTWLPPATLSNTNSAVTIASPTISTQYTVIGANGICTIAKDISVTVIPKIIVAIRTPAPLCLGSSTILEASGGTTYKWLPTTYLSQPNKSSTTVKPNNTIIYTVTVGNGSGCSSSGTVEVIVNPLPIVYAGRDTTINIDESIVLTGTGNVVVGFLSPAGIPLSCNFCSSITVNPQETTCYTLRGQNAFGCFAYDEVCVKITKDYEIYIPNAFTPNGDTKNDVFMPAGYGITEISLIIFDRWGTQIFKSNETKIGWDGTYRGMLCKQDVYIYQVELKTMAGETITKTGHVTLLAKIK